MSRARNSAPTPPGMAGYKPTLLGTVKEGGLIARHGWAAEARQNQCIANDPRATPHAPFVLRFTQPAAESGEACP
jgi:hypothetical protein